MKLISMTDFVLEQEKNPMQTFAEAYRKCRAYAKFLKQPLTLGMFVPCDEEGIILKEPYIQIGGVEKYSEKYQQAKECVLFEGCFLNFKGDVIVKETEFSTLKYADSNWTIEDLIQFDLILTETVIKQIGL